jgi:LCP family protein required for cell wall assembly
VLATLDIRSKFLGQILYLHFSNHEMLFSSERMSQSAPTPGEGGKLVTETIQYDFGITVNFYAHLNFYGFQQVIAQLGGLDVSVDCAIQGHRLKSPELDAFKADSYELYTLPIGYHHLDPYMALWYVRSRGNSNDIDRGRRQMDVLRAIWHQAKRRGYGLRSLNCGRKLRNLSRRI